MMYASKNAEKLFKIFLISVPSSACMFFVTLGLIPMMNIIRIVKETFC